MIEDSELTCYPSQAFENASTNIAAAQMRNSLTTLAESVKDPEQKKASQAQAVTGTPDDLANTLPQLFETEMDNFFALFRRYLNDKAKGTTVYVLSPSTESDSG
jgi:UTP--glucose-1-phosphate uridylyltransferase